MPAESDQLLTTGSEAKCLESGVLMAAAAGLAVEGALASGAEEVPDVDKHPYIQYAHTVGNDHYPLERPLFSSIRSLTR